MVFFFLNQPRRVFVAGMVIPTCIKKVCLQKLDQLPGTRLLLSYFLINPIHEKKPSTVCDED